MSKLETVQEIAGAASAAARAGDQAAAARHWRRLVFHEPGNPAWRLRLAAALGQSPGADAEAIEMLALQQVDAALSSGRPLVALSAALGVSGTDPGALLSDYLSGSPRVGKAPRLSPPLGRTDDSPVPEVATDAPPPDAPDTPVVGPLPPMPLLSLLDADALRALLPHISRRALDAGEVLMAEGEVADALYLVVHGAARDHQGRPRAPHRDARAHGRWRRARRDGARALQAAHRHGDRADRGRDAARGRRRPARRGRRPCPPSRPP
jgi:hypothetical protein